jgi:hypothetical protein
MSSPSPYGDYRAYPGETGTAPSNGVQAGRLWATGAATAVVAVLTAVVATLLVRGVLDIPVFAPEHDGVVGDATTGWLAAVAGVSALVATGLLHLLLVATAQPRQFFAWIVTLVTLAMVLLPFTTDVSTEAKLGTAAVYLAIGAAIGSLLTTTASGVTTPTARS